MTATSTALKKPLPVRAIFILNAIMIPLPLVFFTVVTTRNIDLGGLDPVVMLYTAAAYAVSFAALVYCLRARNGVGVRLVVIANVLIALPAKAYIGIGVAVVSMWLSYRPDARRYFGEVTSA